MIWYSILDNFGAANASSFILLYAQLLLVYAVINCGAERAFLFAAFVSVLDRYNAGCSDLRRDFGRPFGTEEHRLTIQMPQIPVGLAYHTRLTGLRVHAIVTKVKTRWETCISLPAERASLAAISYMS
jgi:hypothetical protein